MADGLGHGGAATTAEQVVEQGTLGVHQLRRVAERAGDEQAQRGHQHHADDAAARVEAAGAGEGVGAHDLGDPRQRGEDEPDHHDQQHPTGQQVLHERGPAGGEAR